MKLSLFIFRIFRFLIKINFIIILSFALFSCEPDKEEISLKEDIIKANKDNKILIRYWDFSRNKEATLWEREALKQFEETHPECRIRYTRVAWTEGRRKISVAINSGDPPDIIGGGFLYQFLDKDVFEPIDDYFKDELKDFYPSALQPFFYKGKHYAVPWYITAYALFLNLDLFEKYGVEPPKDGIWTFEEFSQKIKALSYNKDGTPTGIYGFNFNFSEEHYEAWGFLYSEGVKIISDDGTKCLLNNQQTIEAIQKLIDFERKEKTAYSGKGSYRQEESWTNFFHLRKSAITAQGIWAVSTLRAYNNDILVNLSSDMKKDKDAIPSRELFNFQIALFPIGKSGKPILTSAGVGNFVITKQESEKKKDLCFELVKFLTNAENQKIFASAQTQFPTRISAGNIYADDPVMNRIQPYIGEAISHPTHPAWNRIDGIVQKYMQLAFLEILTVQEAVAEAEKEINRVLRKYIN